MQAQTPYVRRPYVPIELPESARPKQYKHLVYTLACLYFTLESCILKICGLSYGKFECIWLALVFENLENLFLEHSGKNDYNVYRVYQWFQTWAYFRGVVIGFFILSSVFYRSFGNTLRQVNFNIICVILVSVDALLSVILTLCVSGTTNPMTLIGKLYGLKIIVWLCLIFPTYLVSKYYVFARRQGYQQIP